MAKRILLGFLSIGLLVGLSACKTVQGLGEDITKGGQAIERAVE